MAGKALCRLSPEGGDRRQLRPMTAVGCWHCSILTSTIDGANTYRALSEYIVHLDCCSILVKFFVAFVAIISYPQHARCESPRRLLQLQYRTSSFRSSMCTPAFGHIARAGAKERQSYRYYAAGGYGAPGRILWRIIRNVESLKSSSTKSD